ncbi:MAG: MerR family transcriptional regulator [Thermoguttaceae bacterium]
MKHTMSLGDVSRLLNIRPHRLEYAITNRLVREPAERIGGHRVFTLADVRRLAAHFGVTLPSAEAAAEPVAVPAGV